MPSPSPTGSTSLPRWQSLLFQRCRKCCKQTFDNRSRPSGIRCPSMPFYLGILRNAASQTTKAKMTVPQEDLPIEALTMAYYIHCMARFGSPKFYQSAERRQQLIGLEAGFRNVDILCATVIWVTLMIERCGAGHVPIKCIDRRVICLRIYRRGSAKTSQLVDVDNAGTTLRDTSLLNVDRVTKSAKLEMASA